MNSRYTQVDHAMKLRLREAAAAHLPSAHAAKAAWVGQVADLVASLAADPRDLVAYVSETIYYCLHETPPRDRIHDDHLKYYLNDTGLARLRASQMRPDEFGYHRKVTILRRADFDKNHAVMDNGSMEYIGSGGKYDASYLEFSDSLSQEHCGHLGVRSQIFKSRDYISIPPSDFFFMGQAGRPAESGHFRVMNHTVLTRDDAGQLAQAEWRMTLPNDAAVSGIPLSTPVPFDLAALAHRKLDDTFGAAPAVAPAIRPAEVPAPRPRVRDFIKV